MNLILMVMVAVIPLNLSTCTLTIDSNPSPKHKPAAHGKSKHKAKKKYPSEATTESVPEKTPVPPNVKESWWIENYHKLEAAHGDYTIPADAGIKPLPDGRFEVPDKVLTHYQDLLMAKPTPD